MKKLICLIVALAILAVAAPAVAKDVFVQGYYTRDNIYVPPHYRTIPDGNPYNNYSTQGNYNPYTGQQGYVQPQPLKLPPLTPYKPPKFGR